MLDGAATTGDSLGVAARALRKKGVHVGRAVVLLDREEGASENLEKTNKIPPKLEISYKCFFSSQNFVK